MVKAHSQGPQVPDYPHVLAVQCLRLLLRGLAHQGLPIEKEQINPRHPVHKGSLTLWVVGVRKGLRGKSGKDLSP
ncbi:UNVERIFIED_CONTAM: hypothetical protein K2H54_046059 [Gekko kuhli]